MKSANPVWDEYDVSGLFRDQELKTNFTGSVLILRDTVPCVYKKLIEKQEIIGKCSKEVWTLEGFPIRVYGSRDQIDELFEIIRRKLLGIIACDGLKANASAIANMC